MRRFITLMLACTLLLPCKGQSDSVKHCSAAGITFSLPWLNYYHYVDHYKNASAKKFGFFGLGISGYYKKKDQKVSFNAGTTEDLSSPIASINYSKADIKTSIGSSFFELAYSRPLYGNFNFIGGFNFTNYIFRLTSTIDSVKSYKRTEQTLGLSLGLEYRFNKYYSVAGVYRPALASFETDNIYRHLINVELHIDLDFNNSK